MKVVRTEIRDLMEQTTERAARYLETLEARSVFPTVEAVGRLPELGGPLPADGAEPTEVMRLLDQIGSPATVATAGPRYFGFVTGGALPATLAANWLAGTWDQCAGLDVLSPVSSALEEISARWLLELFGLPSKCGVGFVTGATMANFTALAAARNAVLERASWDVEADGLNGAPKITLIGGEEIHISAVKALAKYEASESVELLLGVLRHQNKHVRLAAARVLAECKDKEVGRKIFSRVVQAATAEPDGRVRAALIRALSRIGDPSQYLLVGKALKDPMEEVVVAAIEGLDVLGSIDSIVASRLAPRSLKPSRRASLVSDVTTCASATRSAETAESSVACVPAPVLESAAARS